MSGNARKNGSTKIIPGDTMVKLPRPVRIQRRPGKKARALPTTIRTKNPATIARHEKATKALALKKAGFTFQKIADQLGYASQQNAWYAVQSLLKKSARLDYEEWMGLHIERTEDFLLRLQQQIMKGNPRAIEVAVKVLERQARMVGLDYEDRQGAEKQIAPIQINIIADPRDPDAQRYLAEVAARSVPIDATPVQRTLPASTEGDPQH